MHEPEANSLDQRGEIRLGHGEISPGCCYADPDNVDWSGWMRVAPTTPDRLAIAGDQQRRATFRIQTGHGELGNHVLHPGMPAAMSRVI